MRILLLTQWFDPEPTCRGLLFARKLQELGHEVEVITGFPNYPGGRVYPGYRQKWCSRQNIDGVLVARVPLYPSHDGSVLKRVTNYLSFAVSASLYGIFMARKADVIHAYHPPLTVGLAAALIGWCRRTPFVMDIQDLWPDTLRSTGMLRNQPALDLVNSICNWLYRRASHIVVLSPGFRSLLMQRGTLEAKISLIYNWCDEVALNTPVKVDTDLSFMDGRFNVVFAGTMGKAQALDAVLDASQIVALQDADVQFVFVGGGIEAERLKKASESLSFSNVRFLPRMPMNAVGAVLARASTLLVHLRNDPLFAITVPSKTQAGLAIGKPILMAVRGDAADLLKRANAGETAIPENPASIAAAVLRMARKSVAERDQLGRNARNFYRKELSMDAGVQKFNSVFERVALRQTTSCKKRSPVHPSTVCMDLRAPARPNVASSVTPKS